MKTLKQVMRQKFEKVGDAVNTALLETDANYAQIAEAVRQKCHSETSRASVRFYASKLRRSGEQMPERPRSLTNGKDWGQATIH